MGTNIQAKVWEYRLMGGKEEELRVTIILMLITKRGNDLMNIIILFVFRSRLRRSKENLGLCLFQWRWHRRIKGWGHQRNEACISDKYRMQRVQYSTV